MSLSIALLIVIVVVVVVRRLLRVQLRLSLEASLVLVHQSTRHAALDAALHGPLPRGALGREVLP